MPSMGKLLIASLGVASAGKVSVPKWVMAQTSETCTKTCTSAGGDMKDCYDKIASPMSQADFETILDNVVDTGGKAKCTAFVDRKNAVKGPSISKGVCWYNSKAPTMDCAAAAIPGELRVCRCHKDPPPTDRDTVLPIPYPAVYKRAEEASISFTIKFPFFTKDAFECLGEQKGKAVTGTAKKHPEAFFKMAYGIRQSLGSEAVGIHFVAPKKYSDPLEAKVDVYAAPEDMSGAELFLAKSKIRGIGPYLVEKWPELKMCAHGGTYETYETEFGKSPVFPASLKPTGSWSPASKDEMPNDSMLLTLGVDMRSFGVASAGVLLVAGVAVLWRHRQERELVSTVCE